MTNNSIEHKLKPVILPHELLCHLEKYNQLELCAESRAEYWRHAEEFFPWYQHHPATLNSGVSEGEAHSRVMHVPLHMYADDTRFSTNEKLGVIMLGAVLDKRKNSMSTYWPLFVVRLDSLAQILHVFFFFLYCRLRQMAGNVDSRTSEALSDGFNTLQAYMKPAPHLFRLHMWLCFQGMCPEINYN